MTNTELKREHPKFSHPQSIVPGVSAGNILESHEPHGVPTVSYTHLTLPTILLV